MTNDYPKKYLDGFMYFGYSILNFNSLNLNNQLHVKFNSFVIICYRISAFPSIWWNTKVDVWGLGSAKRNQPTYPLWNKSARSDNIAETSLMFKRALLSLRPGFLIVQNCITKKSRELY